MTSQTSSRSPSVLMILRLRMKLSVHLARYSFSPVLRIFASGAHGPRLGKPPPRPSDGNCFKSRSGPNQNCCHLLYHYSETVKKRDDPIGLGWRVVILSWLRGGAPPGHPPSVRMDAWPYAGPNWGNNYILLPSVEAPDSYGAGVVWLPFCQPPGGPPLVARG